MADVNRVVLDNHEQSPRTIEWELTSGAMRAVCASSESGRGEALARPHVSLHPALAPEDIPSRGSSSRLRSLRCGVRARNPCHANLYRTHRCHHVFHVGTSTVVDRACGWDSKELFPAKLRSRWSLPVARAPDDSGFRIEPIGDCGLHFVLPARCHLVRVPVVARGGFHFTCVRQRQSASYCASA